MYVFGNRYAFKFVDVVELSLNWHLENIGENVDIYAVVNGPDRYVLAIMTPRREGGWAYGQVYHGGRNGALSRRDWAYAPAADCRRLL